MVTEVFDAGEVNSTGRMVPGLKTSVVTDTRLAKIFTCLSPRLSMRNVTL